MPELPTSQLQSVAQAQSLLSAYPSCVSEYETVTLAHACGRIAGQTITSEMDIPPDDNSAMDGIALNSSDYKGDQHPLTLSQRIPAGHSPTPLQTGTAVRIFTGGVVPDGADCVVMQENCQFIGLDQVMIKREPMPGDNIRPRGQDIQRGAQVIQAGQILNPIDISLLSSIGIATVDVKKRLRIAIFSTGDELVEPGTPLRKGQIYNSNRILLQLLCQQLGAEVIDVGVVKDTLLATKDALLKAAQCADLIVSSGGVSVGEEDHVKPALEELGKLEFWKVPLKPGKPVAVGQIKNCKFIGLPGNPVSSFVVFQLLAVPLIRALQGAQPDYLQALPMRANFSKSAGTREEYLRVRVAHDDSGAPHLEQFANLSSGVLSSISWADGLVRQAANQAICAGDLVDFLPMRNSSIW